MAAEVGVLWLAAIPLFRRDGRFDRRSGTLIRKIATAAVYVEDQRKAVEFWTKQVGFRVHREKPMGPQMSWVEVGPPDAESCLVIYPKSMMEDWADRKPSIVFECEDIQKTFVGMRDRGVRFTQEPKALPWGPFAIFRDDEGNSYGLREATHVGMLRHVAPVFRVSDLARSIRFYREQLGFALDFSYDDFYASVHRDGCYIHLSCAAPAVRDQAAFERDQHLDACAVIAGAATLATEFSAAGAPFSVPLRTMPYGVEFYVRDPDGYIIGFVEPAADAEA